MTNAKATVEHLLDKAADADDSADAMRFSQAACNAANALALIFTGDDPKPKLTADHLEGMINRFLGWRLPENFRPDGGISFKAEFNEDTAHPMRHCPSGTNLLDYTQAKAMILHILGNE